MKDTLVLYGQGAAASTYFYTGFAPGFIEVIAWDTEVDTAEWCPLIPEEYSIEMDALGPRALNASHGIRLVKFNDEPGALPGSGGTPSDVENGRFWEANGIEITSGIIGIASGVPFCVIVHRMTVPMVRAVHYATTSETYFQDTSIDFLEAGISGNGKFILINETNNDYAYVGAITQPAANMNHCRIAVYEDEGLGTACDSANFVSGDVIFIIPRQWAQHPLSDIGIMS